jgi:hypothetical protein
MSFNKCRPQNFLNDHFKPSWPGEFYLTNPLPHFIMILRPTPLSIELSCLFFSQVEKSNI